MVIPSVAYRRGKVRRHFIANYIIIIRRSCSRCQWQFLPPVKQRICVGVLESASPLQTTSSHCTQDFLSGAPGRTNPALAPVFLTPFSSDWRKGNKNGLLIFCIQNIFYAHKTAKIICFVDLALYLYSMAFLLFDDRLIKLHHVIYFKQAIISQEWPTCASL